MADTRWFSSYCSLGRATSEMDRRGVGQVIRRFVNFVHQLSGDYPLFIRSINDYITIQRIKRQER
jgi:hypothetical protein